VAEFQKGRLSRLDICDAHPELVRAARGVGEATDEPCPVCDDNNVVLVSYAFGAGLPAHGKLIASRADLTRAGRTAAGDVVCYVVEVCPECSWNHLTRMYPAGAGVDAVARTPLRDRAGARRGG
jgi:hypothetical protein